MKMYSDNTLSKEDVQQIIRDNNVNYATDINILNNQIRLLNKAFFLSFSLAVVAIVIAIV